MRILMVSDVYFPRVNGVSTSIETFRRCLDEAGVAVRLVVPRYGDEAEQPGVIRVPGRPVPGDREDRMVGWYALRNTVLTAAEDCDLIHIQTPFLAHYAGLHAARRLNKPVVATYHTLFEAYLEHYLPWLPARWLRGQARAFSRRQCNALDALIVPSTAMQTKLADYGVRSALHVLPTGIPLARFEGGDGPAFRARLGIAPERSLALFVGRVAHEKNLDFLIEAFAQTCRICPEALLLIAGEGPAEAALQARVQRMGLAESIRFIGYLDRERDLPACYAAADVFAFASVTETQGLVLLEAMAAGIPVCALAEMGTRDILLPGRGCVVPPHDALAFGTQLAELLLDWVRRDRLAVEARAYVEEWSDQAMSRRLLALYAGLCAENLTRRAAWQAGLA